VERKERACSRNKAARDVNLLASDATGRGECGLRIGGVSAVVSDGKNISIWDPEKIRKKAGMGDADAVAARPR
jgi:hypothetical protein